MEALVDRKPVTASKREAYERVPTAKRIAYAAPAFALAVVGIPIYVYPPKVLHRRGGRSHRRARLPSSLGADFRRRDRPGQGAPIGHVTRTRFGRRRPYIAGGAVLFLPGWVLLARQLEKRVTWLVAMAINTGAFLGFFFLGPGDAPIYGVLVFLSGIDFGATIAIPSAMQADVIDYDELLSGKRREGLYIGFWCVTKKLAAALGVGAALTILGNVGYVPNSEQSEQVQLTLRVLYALVPSLCNVAAFFIALSYPITREVHREILAAIAERRAGRTVRDPLRPGRPWSVSD